MLELTQEKRAQIAYDFMVILATNRRPDTDFLTMFSTSKKPEQNRKIREWLLGSHSLEEIKAFTEGLFRDGFEKNIKFFSEDFDRETERLRKAKKSNAVITIRPITSDEDAEGRAEMTLADLAATARVMFPDITSENIIISALPKRSEE